MTSFRYTARNKNGELIAHNIQANTIDDAAGSLIKEGLTPINITPIPEKRLWRFSSLHFINKKIGYEALAIFCRQLFSLTKAGVPILSAIQRLAEIATDPFFAKTLQKVAEEISLGASLSTAMQHHRTIFSPLMIALVTAGESNGRLDEAFLQASKHYELANTSRKRITAALRYPFIVIFLAFSSITLVSVTVIPKFASLYAHFHVTLPLPTRILIQFSLFIQHYWWLIIALVVLLIASASHLLRRDAVCAFIDRAQLKLPLFGSVLERIVMANFSRSLAMLLQTGVPLIQSLTLVANIVGNSYAKIKILSMRGAIERGENLSQAAFGIHFFSPLILQMLSVGEETGHIDKMLFEISYFYEQEVDYDIKQLADKIEPILLILVGCMVLILMLSVFLPMWNMAYLIH